MAPPPATLRSRPEFCVSPSAARPGDMITLAWTMPTFTNTDCIVCYASAEVTSRPVEVWETRGLPQGEASFRCPGILGHLHFRYLFGCSSSVGPSRMVRTVCTYHAPSGSFFFLAVQPQHVSIQNRHPLFLVQSVEVKPFAQPPLRIVPTADPLPTVAVESETHPYVVVAPPRFGVRGAVSRLEKGVYGRMGVSLIIPSCIRCSCPGLMGASSNAICTAGLLPVMRLSTFPSVCARTLQTACPVLTGWFRSCVAAIVLWHDVLCCVFSPLCSVTATELSFHPETNMTLTHKFDWMLQRNAVSTWLRTLRLLHFLSWCVHDKLLQLPTRAHCGCFLSDVVPCGARPERTRTCEQDRPGPLHSTFPSFCIPAGWNDLPFVVCSARSHCWWHAGGTSDVDWFA